MADVDVRLRAFVSPYVEVGIDVGLVRLANS